MALFRLNRAQEAAHSIEAADIYARPPVFGDYNNWSALREQSRTFLKPWEPTWPADDLTRAAFRRRLRRLAEELEHDETYPFFIFRKNDDALMGGMTLGQIRRGVSQTGTLGYWMGEPFAGKGYMSQAVRALCPYAFGPLRLHRIEAACLSKNDASRVLLESCGFQREGFARSYLQINGRWQDHILFAILASDSVPPAKNSQHSSGNTEKRHRD